MPLLLAITVGAVVPIQTAINTRLRHSVGSPIVTAWYSFLIATAIAAVLAWMMSGQALPDMAKLAGQPLWLYLGGLMGVTFIVGNILLFPRIGSVQTVVLPILGQSVMGLAIDQWSLYCSPHIPLSIWRILGAILALLGVLLVLEVGFHSGFKQGEQGIALWLWRAFGVFIGMCSATQTAVNGHLGTLLGSTTQAGEISLVVGLVLLLLLCAWPAYRARGLSTFSVRPGPWWMWLGGVLGGLFVIGGATLGPIIGTGTMVIASVSGTMLAGQIVESLGLLGVKKTPIDARRAFGLIVIFAGVLMVRLL